MSKKPVFNMNECINCGICVQACPLSCLSLSLEGKQGKYRNVFPELVSDKCIGCGLCMANCPMDAIEMQELNIEQTENKNVAVTMDNVAVAMDNAAVTMNNVAAKKDNADCKGEG